MLLKLLDFEDLTFRKFGCWLKTEVIFTYTGRDF